MRVIFCLLEKRVGGKKLLSSPFHHMLLPATANGLRHLGHNSPAHALRNESLQVGRGESVLLLTEC